MAGMLSPERGHDKAGAERDGGDGSRGGIFAGRGSVARGVAKPGGADCGGGSAVDGDCRAGGLVWDAAEADAMDLLRDGGGGGAGV